MTATRMAETTGKRRPSIIFRPMAMSMTGQNRKNCNQIPHPTTPVVLRSSANPIASSRIAVNGDHIPLRGLFPWVDIGD